jgi:hypothetical protein
MDGAAARGAALFWLRLIGFALIPAVAARLAPAPVTGMMAGLGLLAPVPLAFGAVRRGLLEGLLATSLAALGTSLVLGSGEGFFFLLQNAPLVAGVRWAVKSALPAYLPVLGSALLVAAVAIGGLLLNAAAAGMPMDRLWWETADPFGFTQQQPQIPADQPGAEQLREQLQWIMGIWRRLFAGIWVASVILIFLFYVVVTRGLLLRQGEAPPPGGSYLAGWALPWPFVGAFILLGAALLLDKGQVQTLAANALVPLGTLYGIQGLAVSGHVLASWNVPWVMRFLAFFLLALWIPVVLIAGVGLAGLFDTWFDFRRRFPPPVVPPGDTPRLGDGPRSGLR